jgi:ATP-dependent DNA helicase DinG
MLRNTFTDVKAQLREFEGMLIKQGDDDNARLLELFREDTSSVLFATDSFWQGVDIPGESLSQVIIVKLPFSVPNDPVFTARAEAVTLRGGNSFMELSVPEAVIKFRQGFGRLIRRSDDRGTVIVLDRRIYEKRYGQIFLNSIPDTKRVYEKLDIVVKDVGQFLFDR